MKKVIYLIGITFVTLLIFFACSKDELLISKESIIIPSNSVIKTFFESSILQHDDFVSTINTKVKTWETKQVLLNDVFLAKNFDELIVQNVIFYTKEETIKGIGIYYFSKVEKNYFFDLYKYQSGSDEFKKEFSYLSSSLLMRELLFLGKNTFENADVDLFVVKNAKKFNVLDDYSDFSLHQRIKSLKVISKSKKVSLEELSKGLSSSFAICGHVGNCRSQIGDVCQSPSFTCVENIGCGEERFKTSLQRFNIQNTHHYLSNIILDNKYYSLRNRFLAKSQKGRQYIGLYYASGQHFINALDANTTLGILDYLPEINIAIDRLINPNFKGVIISRSLLNKILKTTQKLKKNSSSNGFKGIISMLESDLTNISGKTRLQVNNHFGL